MQMLAAWTRSFVLAKESAVSSISSLSGSPDLYTVLQQVTDQNPSSTTAASTSGTSPDASQSVQGAGKHHGHHHKGGGGSAISSQIESAVSDALQNAQPGSDPNQVIQNAVAETLKKAQQGSGTDAQGTGNPTSADSAATQGAGQGANAISQQDFQALLKSNGIDPQQFQQDFASAVQSVQSGGNVDFASLFQSFPPGSAVDAVA